MDALRLDARRLALDAPNRSASGLDAFDPRARIICGVGLSAAISSLTGGPALLCAAAPPLLLLPWGPLRPLLRALAGLNAANLVMMLLLAVTWPGESLWGPLTREGLFMGLLVTARLNLISIVLMRLIVDMGLLRADAALARLGLSKKLRALLLLTLRGVALLMERTEAALLALRLRAPRLGGLMRWRAFACLLGASLLQSADRSERMALAMECRGGLAGFAQVPPLAWRRRDTGLCLFCATVSIVAVWLQMNTL